MGTWKLGLDIGLYLSPAGRLVITDRPRPDLTPLSHSRGFALSAPLDEAVTATVELLVEAVDVEIPADCARFVIADEEADADLVRAVKRVIESLRAAGADRNADGPGE